MNFPLVGNERVRDTVNNMLASRNIPHAILIEGDNGFGKTLLAQFLCCAALCESSDAPCGKCEDCRLFKSGNHPDVISISLEKGKKVIPVQKVREIIADSATIPQRSNRKVFIIYRADTMNIQAQNALLKILEEPPASVIFILTAVSRSFLLETVVSRCAVLTLSSPDEQTGLKYISGILPQTDEQEILHALKDARGSIGEALAQLRKNDSGSARDLAKKFLKMMQNESQYSLLKLLFQLEKDRTETYNFYSYLEELIVSEIRSCTSNTLIKRYERLYDTIVEHRRMLDTNVNLSLLLTLLAAVATER